MLFLEGLLLLTSAGGGASPSGNRPQGQAGMQAPVRQQVQAMAKAWSCCLVSKACLTKADC